MKHNRWRKLAAAALAASFSLVMMVPAWAEEGADVSVENSVESEVQILEENGEKAVVIAVGGVTTPVIKNEEENGGPAAGDDEETAENTYMETDGAAAGNMPAGDRDISGQMVPETSEVSLDVPQVYALDSRWTDKRFDPNAKDTIGKTGCTICCLTAVMSYMDDTFYRPDELCKKMSFSNGAMAWYGEIDSKFKTNQTYSLAAIKEKLLNDEPVIVKSYQKAKNKKGQWYNKAHFVVVTGFKNNGESEADYMIMDPGKRDTDGRTLKGHFSTHPNNKQLYYLKNR